ncbi:hypothetical protein B0A48_17798 [Cryoendolithus antarcticus]|uniref:Uncharacterized protein n=1 Tax=Cryoendolithus antarcticus TaxID=1507870 RepID=A0A1V8SAR5_9PEZI|nr:hypothetical protein B0A48_17798 [Cryoendolithus antarcticus]
MAMERQVQLAVQDLVANGNAGPVAGVYLDGGIVEFGDAFQHSRTLRVKMTLQIPNLRHTDTWHRVIPRLTFVFGIEEVDFSYNSEGPSYAMIRNRPGSAAAMPRRLLWRPSLKPANFSKDWTFTLLEQVHHRITGVPYLDVVGANRILDARRAAVGIITPRQANYLAAAQREAHIGTMDEDRITEDGEEGGHGGNDGDDDGGSDGGEEGVREEHVSGGVGEDHGGEDEDTHEGAHERPDGGSDGGANEWSDEEAVGGDDGGQEEGHEGSDGVACEGDDDSGDEGGDDGGDDGGDEGGNEGGDEGYNDGDDGGDDNMNGEGTGVGKDDATGGEGDDEEATDPVGDGATEQKSGQRVRGRMGYEHGIVAYGVAGHEGSKSTLRPPYDGARADAMSAFPRKLRQQGHRQA